MSKYNLAAFKKLNFNVTAVGLGRNIWDVFTPLEWVRKIEVPEGYDANLMMRMVILLFDKNSPLLETQNLTERAHEACVYARIVPDRKKKQYPEWVVECASGNVTAFNLMTMYYLSMTEHPRVALLTALRSALLKKSAELMTGTNPKAFSEIEAFEKQIEKREEQLLSGYIVSEKQRMDIDAFLIDVDLDLRPEKMALVRESGKPIFEEFDVYSKEI